MTLTGRLRSVLTDAKERAAGDVSADTRGSDGARPDESPPDSETSLFECARCDNVYVAVEKSTCSTCESAVDEVSATLTDPPRNTTEDHG